MANQNDFSRSKCLIPLLLASPAVASSAALTFDCDVPPNRFSSVTGDVTNSMTISGTIQAMQMRSGENLPVAGARLVSVDEQNATGFQLVATSAHSKQFDIIFNTKRGSDVRPVMVGHVGAGQPIPFRLMLSSEGKVTLNIGDATFNADFLALLSANGMAFCSTGQFKFTGLTFGADVGPASLPAQ